MNIDVKEILKVTADPTVFNDVDKMIIIFDHEGEQKKITVPWEDFTTKNEFKKILKKSIETMKPKKEIINLSNEWKGEYKI